MSLMVRRRIRYRIYTLPGTRNYHRGGRTGEGEGMTRIAIIGAGCAGLGAAATLMEDGADVSVDLIEANDRIGGRARTSTQYHDLPVDLGPQFIQDPKI